MPASKNRKFAMTIVGMFVVGMLALIILVLLSNFPGPSEGESDKSGAPAEGATKAK
jgi:hypothetical protein